MLTTTDAIVLSLQPHSDKSHILHAYTRAGGRVNYRVYGLGRKHAIGMYSPLSVLQITADHSPSKPPTLKEAVLLTANSNGLTANIYKQTVALFVSEVLYHVLRHPMADEPMFDFLTQAIRTLNETDEPQNFHLHFLTDFAAMLGFAMPGTSSRKMEEMASDDKGDLPRTRKERQETLQALCAYFAEHVETWEAPRSLDVLMEVFD